MANKTVLEATSLDCKNSFRYAEQQMEQTSRALGVLRSRSATVHVIRNGTAGIWVMKLRDAAVCLCYFYALCFKPKHLVVPL